ncbi:MAG: hypothetical protein COA82_10500 [Alkaliphilus sp.]|nr:MAG: hypothetical protein COA82_10500 [Alkaliphilus sp.]
MLDDKTVEKEKTNPDTSASEKQKVEIEGVEGTINNKNDNFYSKEKGDWANAIHTYILSNLEMFLKTSPFANSLQNYEWWQMNYNYHTIFRGYMPYLAYIESAEYYAYYHPYQHTLECHRMIYAYQHYMFGIVYDEKKKALYYVYAIPGKKTRADQPYEGKTGFTHWRPSKQENNVDAFGYWLLHIDAITGKVTNPLAETAF